MKVVFYSEKVVSEDTDNSGRVLRQSLLHVALCSAMSWMPSYSQHRAAACNGGFAHLYAPPESRACVGGIVVNIQFKVDCFCL